MRGFVLVRDAAGHPVVRARGTRPGMGVTLQFQDGAVGAVIGGGTKSESAGASKARRAPGRKGDSGQGSLL